MSSSDTTDIRLLCLEQHPDSLAALGEFCPEVVPVRLALSEAQSAPDLISREKIEVVACDLSPGSAGGLDALSQIRRVHPNLPVIMVLPGEDYSLLLTAFREGADEVVAHPFEADEICRSVVNACEKGRSRMASARKQTVAERSLDDLVLLKEIGETTSSEEDLQALLQRVVVSIQEAMAVEIVSLMMEDDEGHLVIRAASGLPAEVAERTRIAPGEGISGHVLASGETVLIDDLATDGRFPSSHSSGRYRTGSLLSVPVQHLEKTTGVLNVNNKQGGASFTAEDQELLQAIAHQTALAIENFKLVGYLRQKSQELEKANEDLLGLHQSRTLFVCNLSHELKTPLTSVLGFADLLMNFYDQVDDEQVMEYLGRIHHEALYLEYLVNGMLRFFSIDSGSEHWNWQEIDVAESLESILVGWESGILEMGLHVTKDISGELPPVWSDKDKLTLLLDALVDNAVKFNQYGGTISLAMEERDVDGHRMVYLGIANQGKSVAVEDAGDVFREYSQLGDLDTEKPSGVGIGLATCCAILRQMRGDIFLEPMDGEGTCFGLLLPTKSAYEDMDHDRIDD